MKTYLKKNYLMKKMFHIHFSIFVLMFIGIQSFAVMANSLSANTKHRNTLVVYNGNIGLVHESKEMSFKQGKQSVIYEDVAHTVQTDSVNVVFPDDTVLFSQQYRFDRITTKKLLDAHIDKKIKIRIKTNKNKFIIKAATMLAAESNRSIIQLDNGDIFSIDAADVIFETIPKSLITKPSLVWNIETKKASKAKISLDYLINGITWQSNYILNIIDDKADLSGWISVDNRSGKEYKNIQLNVLAGDINRVKAPRPEIMYKARATVMADSAVAHVAHEGYHFYTIPFRVTLANNEKTQIKFVDEKSIPIIRRYESQLTHPRYLSGERKQKVSQFIDIKSLDVPLPAGIIRSYSKVDQTKLFLGESRIEHTPKHDKISLRLGTNFDVKVTQKLLQQNDDKYYFDRKVNYKVSNHGDKAKQVSLLVPYINSKSKAQASIKTKQAYRWKNANSIEFSINIKANSSEDFDVYYRGKR